MFLGGKINLNFSLIITFQIVAAVGIFFKVVIKKFKLNFFIIKIELEYINIVHTHTHKRKKKKKVQIHKVLKFPSQVFIFLNRCII